MRDSMSPGRSILKSQQKQLLVEADQVDDVVLSPINQRSQIALSQKVVSHTYRLYGTHLLYAKDVPTYQAPNAESL